MKNSSVIEKIKASNNPFFIKDILTIYLKKELFLKSIFQNIKILWVQQEKEENLEKIKEKLKTKKNIFIDENAKDIFYKTKSIWCTYCTLWKWATVVLSYKCHRDCFFCYEETPLDPKVKINPYNKDDMNIIFKKIDTSFSNTDNKTLAITWWEPFLFTDKVYEILEYVNEKYPWKNKRIYTTGELINEEKLKKLKLLWIDEMRYSIKPGEEPDIELYKLTKKYIKLVLIEMPIQPDSREYMIHILTKIDNSKSVDWVNLNELTFNNLNAKKYKENNLKLDLPNNELDIYHRYYDVSKIEIWVYWSKLLALELIDYFSDRDASFYMHYCDLDTVSSHHYIYKRNSAQNLWLNYSQITRFWLHKILRLYWNINDIISIINKNNINDFYKGYHYVDLNLNHLDLFKKYDILKVIIYKNYDYKYDVDFELINV